jgi:protocatechuate 3,4-dioxygenase beta subunit
MKKLPVVCIWVILIAMAAAGSQQKTGTLKGKIEDEKGKPIAGAEVRIMSSRDRSVSETKTDASGTYSFEVAADEYTISFQAEGYQEGSLQEMQQVEEGKETRVKTIRLPKATHTSLIRGSVFDSEGRSISGARIKLVRIPTDAEQKEGKHFKGLSRDYISNNHGEFAFRLPSARARYRITAAAPGYRPDTKEVDVNEREAVPVAMTLLPLKKEN